MCVLLGPSLACLGFSCLFTFMTDKYIVDLFFFETQLSFEMKSGLPSDHNTINNGFFCS